MPTTSSGTPTHAQVIEKCKRSEDLTWSEYCVGANATLSDQFHGDKYPKHLALAVIQNFITAGQMLDELKKALFYNKRVEDSVATHANYLLHTLGVDVKLPKEDDAQWDTKAVKPELIHALLGMACEAVELVEILGPALEYNEPLDLPHLEEEMGDLFWFIAILYVCVSEAPDLNPTLRRNLLKLDKRFGKKFSSHKAINRDLIAEQAAMV